MLKCFVLVFNRWRASSTWTRPTSTHIGWRVKETFPETFKSQWDLKNKNVIHRSRSVRIGRNRVPSVWELVLPALHCMTLHCIVLYFFPVDICYSMAGRSVLGEAECPRSEYRSRPTASGGTQNLGRSFSQYGPPSQWITYINWKKIQYNTMQGHAMQCWQIQLWHLSNSINWVNHFPKYLEYEKLQWSESWRSSLQIYFEFFHFPHSGLIYWTVLIFIFDGLAVTVKPTII